MVFMIVYSSPRSRSDQLVANSCTFLRIRVRSMKITRACSNANSETTGLTMREIARVLIASLSAVLIVGCTTEKPPARLNRESATTESEISPPVNAGSLAAKANELARSGDLSGATTLVKQALIQFPDDGAILELAGDLAAAKGLSKEAIDRYESALDTFSNRSSNGASSKPTSPSIQLMDKIGRQWMNLGEPYRAISQLQRMHQLDPNDTRTRRDLAGLLGSMGMERRAAEHLRFLIQHKQAGVNELVVISDLSRPQADESICNYALKSNAEDLRPRYALARKTCYDNKWSEVIDVLRSVWIQDPSYPEASVFFGRALVETTPDAGQDEVLQWVATANGQVRQHPQYWLALGIWCDRQKLTEQAAKAFWRAASIDENHSEALSRLAVALAQLGRESDSQLVARRAKHLVAMRDDVDSLLFWRKNSQRAASRIAQSMKRLGRLWEAAYWAKVSLSMTQDPEPRATAVYTEIVGTLKADSPWQRVEDLVCNKVDLRELPDPKWNVQPKSMREHKLLAKSQIRFVDEAVQRGLEHVCKIDADEADEAGLWIYQSGAGGGAAIDYDLDAWPDLYLTNCDGQPKTSDSTSNRLYRNLNGTFSESTDFASCQDREYAQGVCVGDLNSDGFPDLFVGCFGVNFALINNGDGTFSKSDLVSSAQNGATGGVPARSDWTTSVAIADLNQDAIADVYQVNYVEGDDVVTRKCFPDNVQQHRSCGPLVFPAAKDRVLQGTANGNFKDVTDTWFANAEAGRGLGVVVGNLRKRDGMNAVDVYVANDMTANHYWSLALSEESSDRDPNHMFVEQAAVRGLAVNARSLSQASMGIAADDADNDGDLDLYVTHFTDEYNTLYQQVGQGIWADKTAEHGLSSPTMPMLAYGTQWLDANADGIPELFVANGNVDDFSHNGKPFRMQMQLFQQRPNGRFQAMTPNQAGRFLSQKRLGRSLFTADLNRDHRPDVVVTFLFDPVALLMNRSEQANAALEIRLVGTQIHRDAVGSFVSIDCAGQTQTKYLLAGDGYQCSNERVVRFVCPVDPTAEISTRVQWANGQIQETSRLEWGLSYTLIQSTGDTTHDLEKSWRQR